MRFLRAIDFFRNRIIDLDGIARGPKAMRLCSLAALSPPVKLAGSNTFS